MTSMVNVAVLISTNSYEEQKQYLDIPKEAMEEFLSTGFCEGVYDARVVFSCMPHAVDPEIMQIIMDLGEIAETTIAWATIIGAIIKFTKGCKGYKSHLSVRKRKGNKEIEVEVELDDNSDTDKVIKQIKKLLKEEKF